MNHIQFNALTPDERWKIVFGKEARFIAFRDYYNHKVSLFDCGDFFAEYHAFEDDNTFFKIEGIPLDHKNVNLYINYALKAESFDKSFQTETHTAPPDDGEGIYYGGER